MTLSVDEVQAFRERLAQCSTEQAAGVDADTALSLIRVLEEVKNVATAAQASLTVVLHEAQTAADKARGIGAAETARVVAAQVGLARRTSPRLGRRFLGVAGAMSEMPHTDRALRAGVIGEWQATQVVAETAFLSLADRQTVDEAVQEVLGKVSDQRLVTVARSAAYRADPAAFVARRAKAEKDRRVSLRPAPDAMTQLSALLPVADGVACWAALNAVGPDSADDERGRGALMADALVSRITGRPARYSPQPNVSSPAEDDPVASPTEQANGEAVAGPASPVAVNLMVPIESLTGDAAGWLEGFGAIPADVVRDLVARNEAAGGLLRRVFTAPGTGDLVGMESRSRRFSGLLAVFVALRDQVCRTPFCGARIRQTDHLTGHASGGATSASNAGGMCETCNYVKEHPDMKVTGTGEDFTVQVRRIQARSTPPSPPGRRRPIACAEHDYRRSITVRLPILTPIPSVLRC